MGRGAELRPLPNFFLDALFKLDLRWLQELNLKTPEGFAGGCPMPRLMSHRGRVEVYSLLSIVVVLFLPATIFAQAGRASTGTGGIHTIQGYIFFPSGRRAEGQQIV